MAKPTEELFLFVNPKSGGNKGQDFLKVPQPFTTNLKDGREATLHIYSLIDEQQRDHGFNHLKQVIMLRGAAVRTIVGGGDGTVMWADSEATKRGIDTSRQCIFGIVPLGTGNDFSRVAGWGGKNPRKILDNDYRVLRTMISDWCEAVARPHDVWMVTLDVDEVDGSILKVDGDKKEHEVPEKVKTMPMINYFSIGQESKVGVAFDKHRTKSQGCNLFVYACQGLGTELDCTTIQHVGDLVSALHAGADHDSPLLFGFDEERDVPELVGNPESLMFLNVNSYAGGAGHFWQIDSPVGVQPDPDPKDVDVQADPGDGRLEVVALPSIANIALDQVVHEARRIHSGGPYYLEFFGPMEGQDTLDTYCEVDGEFYHLVNALTVSVAYGKKLQVLQNLAAKDRDDWAKWMSPAVWAPSALSLPEFHGIPSLAGMPAMPAMPAMSDFANMLPAGMPSLPTGNIQSMLTEAPKAMMEAPKKLIRSLK